jgi:tRNA U34 5-carboxymethylaminomethyl modifying enzyme MnmG/GidA
MSKNTNPDARIEKRNALLTALAKARGDVNPSSEISNEQDSENNCYYTLTKEEVEALVSGNMEKIESWVSNLDRRHATWLLRWLIKESG